MAASQVAIVVDSTATLPSEFIEQYQLHVIPQILNWEGKTYKDGVDITPDEFYSQLKIAKVMPTTSQPSAGEFYDYFKQVAETSDSIVGVFISEHLSVDSKHRHPTSHIALGHSKSEEIAEAREKDGKERPIRKT